MGGNISKTQEERKLTWSVRATEGTGTCGGKTRQNKQYRGQLGEDREKKKKRTQGTLRAELYVCLSAAALCICKNTFSGMAAGPGWLWLVCSCAIDQSSPLRHGDIIPFNKM